METNGTIRAPLNIKGPAARLFPETRVGFTVAFNAVTLL